MSARLGPLPDLWIAAVVVGLQPLETLSFCNAVLPSPSHLWEKAPHCPSRDKKQEEEEEFIRQPLL